MALGRTEYRLDLRELGVSLSIPCETLLQMLALLEGRKIAQPMKYISNFLIATLLALIINYFIVMAVSKANKPSDEKLLKYMNHSLQVSNLAVEFSHQTRVYSPQESSSGGGGGGGGGGGSSGGGGGHSF
jgi:uncharacterized protein